MTTSGFVSNHTYGRGLDIASIDGEIVGPGSALAREVASELSDFPPSIRGDEIGSPFAISGPGYFTDAAHQNHIHVGFKTEITPDWKQRPGLQADTPAAAPGVAPIPAPVPGAPAGAPAAGIAPGVAAAAPARHRPEARLRAVRGALRRPSPARTAAADGGTDSGLFAALDPKAAAARAGRGGSPAPRGRAAPADPTAPAGGGGVDVGAVGDAYPGDDAPKEQIAAWMATEAKKRGLPPQLPVMASLVESGLKNLNFGDADSVGFFQMRLSIWNNQPEYAGYPENPDKQLDWFLDQAEASSKPNASAAAKPIDDPSQFGEWIADVERPAEQFRGRYQLQLDQANNLLNNAPAPRAGRARGPGPGCAGGGVAGGGSRCARAAAAAGGRGATGRARAGQARADRSRPVRPGRRRAPAASPTPKRWRSSRTRTSPSTTSGSSDIKAGRIDPRIIAVLAKLSQEHEIIVSMHVLGIARA